MSSNHSQETQQNLDEQNRAINVENMYSYLNSNQLEPLEPTLLTLHRIGLDGWDLTKTKRYSNSGEVSRHHLELARPGNYRDDASFGYTSVENAKYFYICPSSTDIPVIMSSFSRKYDELLQHPDAKANAHLIAAWTMIKFGITHPFYDGNGRVLRTILPYTLKRLDLIPQYIDTKNNGIRDVINNSIATEIKNIYQLGNIFPDQMENGGLSAAFAYAKKSQLTREFIVDYQSMLYPPIISRVSRASMEALNQSRSLQLFSKVLKSTPFHRK